MKSFNLSLIALSCAALLPTSVAFANSQATAKNNDDIEVVSVYGRQNKVVLNSGLATKSNMSLMETPAAVVVVDSE